MRQTLIVDVETKTQSGQRTNETVEIIILSNRRLMMVLAYTQLDGYY